MDISLEMRKAIEQSIYDEILNADYSTSTTVNTAINNLISKEQLNGLVEELEKSKVNYIQSYLVEKGTVVIIDHEKMRKTYPYHEERGKTLLVNTSDTKLIKAISESGMINYFAKQ